MKKWDTGAWEGKEKVKVWARECDWDSPAEADVLYQPGNTRLLLQKIVFKVQLGFFSLQASHRQFGLFEAEPVMEISYVHKLPCDASVTRHVRSA